MRATDPTTSGRAIFAGGIDGYFWDNVALIVLQAAS